MSKEKVFIVLSHKNMLAKGSHPGRKGDNASKQKWEVAEQVEFVSSVKSRHIQSASAIGDYINRKMLIGSRYGMSDYTVFENYIDKKYPTQMEELGKAYGDDRVKVETQEVFVDQHGVVREKTVFDV